MTEGRLGGQMTVLEAAVEVLEDTGAQTWPILWEVDSEGHGAAAAAIAGACDRPAAGSALNVSLHLDNNLTSLLVNASVWVSARVGWLAFEVVPGRSGGGMAGVQLTNGWGLSANASLRIVVLPLNQPPSFSLPESLIHAMSPPLPPPWAPAAPADAALRTAATLHVSRFAQSIRAGPASDAHQMLSFVLLHQSDPTLLDHDPAVSLPPPPLSPTMCIPHTVRGRSHSHTWPLDRKREQEREREGATPPSYVATVSPACLPGSVSSAVPCHALSGICLPRAPSCLASLASRPICLPSSRAVLSASLACRSVSCAVLSSFSRGMSTRHLPCAPSFHASSTMHLPASYALLSRRCVPSCAGLFLLALVSGGGAAREACSARWARLRT